MSKGQLQMGILAALVGVVSLTSIAYIVIAQPDYLRKSRAGVPHFTPPVEHPETGSALDLEVLVEHYKGE